MAAKKSPPRKKNAPKAPAKAARPTKKAAPKGKRAAAKATPAARKAPARKQAKRPARPAGVPKHVPHNARPAIKQRAGEAGQEVPMGKEMARAEHEHQDPSNTAGIEQAPAQTMPENYGQFKNKAVARMDKPQNWFRRAAKPKQ